jgi:hypothetical protein
MSPREKVEVMVLMLSPFITIVITYIVFAIRGEA